MMIADIYLFTQAHKISPAALFWLPVQISIQGKPA